MLVFKDVFTDDKLCSDLFPMKLADGLIWEFKGRHVVREEGEIVLDSANPSAKGEDIEKSGGDAYVERGIDFVLNHRLQPMSVYEDKKIFQGYIKDFLKKVIEHMQKEDKSEDKVNEFKEKIQAWVMSLLKPKRFKKLSFYIGENMLVGEGQVAIVEYRDEDEGKVPYLMLIKEALTEEKY